MLNPRISGAAGSATGAIGVGGAARINHDYWAGCRNTHVAVGPYYRRVGAWLPVLCERLLGPDDQVLDVGCGDGEYTELIAAHCRSVRAFDLSPALVAQASSRQARNIDWQLGDVATLSRHRDASFDAIFAMGVFVTIHGDAFEQAVADLATLVRPGGCLVTRDSVTAGQDVVRHVHEGYIAHYRSTGHFVGAVESAGFRLERTLYLDTFDDLTNSFYVFRREARAGTPR